MVPAVVFFYHFPGKRPQVYIVLIKVALHLDTHRLTRDEQAARRLKVTPIDGKRAFE